MKEYNNIWKYLQQELTLEEEKSFQVWIDMSPSNLELYDDVKAIWKESQNIEEIKLFDTEKNWAEFEEEIKEHKSRNIRSIRWIGFAASLLLVSSLFLAYFITKSDPLYESFVTNDQSAEILLADGSKINLEKNSSLKYFTHLDEGFTERRVYLDGKASFDVMGDNSMPFIVEVRETGVKALGTNFIVDLKDSSNITVENIEGLIKFYELENEENAIILKKGDIIKFNGSSFINLKPPKKPELQGNIYTLEQIIDILLDKYDGRFNTGPYGNYDLTSKIRLDLNQPLEIIMQQLSMQRSIHYVKTCSNCYELRGLNLPK